LAVREPSEVQDPGGEVIWLHDQGSDPEVAGPLAVDVADLDGLVEERLATLGQVAVVGTVSRMRQDAEGVGVELWDPAMGLSIPVDLEAMDGDDQTEFRVGDRVTALGCLACRESRIVIVRAELFSPISVSP
jgi:hypothetical protein